MHNLLKLLKLGLQLIIGWLVILPLSLLIKKQKNLITFIGRDNGKFTDNVKYFFLYLHKLKPEGITYFFVTEDKSTYQELKKLDLPALYYPAIKTIFVLLKSHILIVDNWTWILNLKYFLLHKTIKIQIWHGVPFKKIELDTDIEYKTHNSIYIHIRNMLGFRFPKYDCVVSTSEFISKTSFLNSFKTKNIIDSGYPRNDILFNKTSQLDLLGTDIENYYRIRELNKNGFTVILYSPTFRDTGGDILSDEIIDLDILDEFARINDIVFVFKFHPSPKMNVITSNYKTIIFYDPSKDVYPLLPFSDIMITDYSSIYFDYLLLDKPIIFFPYDLNKYLSKDRQLYFEYNNFTPGPKAVDQKGLENEILVSMKDKNDIYKEHRNTIRDKVFTFRDGNSAQRLWQYIENNYL